MSPQCSLDDRAVHKLKEARDWRLIALLCERPHGTWWHDVEELARGCDDEELTAAAASARTATECEYLAVLGPGGIASPREVGYRRTTDPANVLACLQAYYRAFAFEPDAEDPPDHVGMEAGFAGWLCLKEAYAIANNDGEALRVTSEALREFVSTHLACVAHGVAQRVADLETGHLHHVARALLARVGPLPRMLEGDWVPNGLDETPCGLTCGLAGSETSAGDEIPPEFTAGLRGGTQ